MVPAHGSLLREETHSARETSVLEVGLCGLHCCYYGEQWPWHLGEPAETKPVSCPASPELKESHRSAQKRKQGKKHSLFHPFPPAWSEAALAWAGEPASPCLALFLGQGVQGLTSH